MAIGRHRGQLESETTLCLLEAQDCMLGLSDDKRIVEVSGRLR